MPAMPEADFSQNAVPPDPLSGPQSLPPVPGSGTHEQQRAPFSRKAGCGALSSYPECPLPADCTV